MDVTCASGCASAWSLSQSSCACTLPCMQDGNVSIEEFLNVAFDVLLYGYAALRPAYTQARADPRNLLC
eukprot:4618160-Pleurochrysis_carterae.AAC.3